MDDKVARDARTQEQPDDALSRMDDKLAEDIRTRGWAAAGSRSSNPPFLYTIGLVHTCRHPEFIMFGTDPDSIHALFTTLIANIRGGQSYAEPGMKSVTVGSVDHRVGFRRVHPTQHPRHLVFALRYCQRIGRAGELEAVQAFWPDAWGAFPFEPDCNQTVEQLQPRLDIGLTPLDG